jgi:excisionase family DNA binding protein
MDLDHLAPSVAPARLTVDDLDPLDHTESLTVEQVAEIFRVSPMTIRREISPRRTLAAVRVGRSWRVSPAAVLCYREEQSNGHVNPLALVPMLPLDPSEGGAQVTDSVEGAGTPA